MKLSIIVPVYNTEEFLPACLDSVIYSELNDYEIIVVNDGSTDSSLSIALKYAENYPGLIKLIDKKNGGLGDARNAGIDAAEGEFLLFLDSDDKLAPTALSEIMDSLNEDFDILIFDLQQVNIDGENIGLIKGADKAEFSSFADYPELLFQPPAACNKLIRRSLFVENSHTIAIASATNSATNNGIIPSKEDQAAPVFFVYVQLRTPGQKSTRPCSGMFSTTIHFVH